MTPEMVAFLVLIAMNAVLGTLSLALKIRSKLLMAAIVIISILALYLLIFSISISLYTVPAIIAHGILIILGILSLIFD